MKKLPTWVPLSAALFLYAVLLFRVVWPQGQVIHSMDYNYGLMAMYKTELPAAFIDGFWRGFPLLGRVGSTPPTFTNLTLAVLPMEAYMDWIYPLHLLIASGFLIGFLRVRQVSWAPALTGALTAFWLGSNLTLIHPGHLLKYGVLLCAAATLFCLEKLHLTRSWRWAVLSGGFLGWMFMHQADVALFFGLILGAYHLFRTAEHGKSYLPKAGILTLILLLTAGMFVWEAYDDQMETQVRNVEILQQGSEEEKWDFATQWSFPPSEWMDLISPGYWGWTSQHETAPYHGVTGQSAEWEIAKMGLPNLRSESVYLGVIPLLLCALAWARPKGSRKEIGFWTAALVITLLLSFGKFTPFYRLFSQLPLVNAIRNPNKFLQVFQLCAGILAAFGLQALLADSSRRMRKYGAFVLLGISLFLGGLSLMTNPASADQAAAFADTLWQSRAASILQNRQLALLHASLLSGMGALCILGLQKAAFRPLIPGAFGLLLMVDGLLLGRNYLQPAPTDFVKDNALVDFLKENLGSQRVSFLNQDGISSFWMTQVFPTHHIAFADIAVAPRLDQAYQDYFESIGTNRIRMWQDFGVKYVLAPRSASDALFQQVPALRGMLREAWSYSLAQSAPGVLEILPGSARAPGNQVLLELQLPSERFTLYSVAENSTESPGEITGVLQTDQGFLLQAEVNEPGALLRLSDRFDPALRIRINGGSPQPLQEADGLFAAAEVPAGLLEIELFANLPWKGRAAQGIGILLCVATAGSLFHSSRTNTAPTELFH